MVGHHSSVYGSRRGQVVTPTRRGFLAGMAGFATLGLAACGSGVDDATPEGPSRRVDTAFGPVQVPEQSRRVVCADYFTALTLADIGFPLAGVISYDETTLPRRYRSLTRLPQVGTNGKPNPQAIGKLGPDLVFSLEYETKKNLAGVYDELSKVAPTVLITVERQGDWPLIADQVGTAVGRKADVDRLKSSYQARAADFQRTNADVLGRTKWAWVSGGNSAGQWILNHAGSNLGAVMAEAGMAPVRAAAGQRDNGQSYSYEQLDTLNDADVILYSATFSGKPMSKAAELLDQPLFKGLPAVREGHVFPTPHLNVVSYRWAIDALDSFEDTIAKL